MSWLNKINYNIFVFLGHVSEFCFIEVFYYRTRESLLSLQSCLLRHSCIKAVSTCMYCVYIFYSIKYTFFKMHKNASLNNANHIFNVKGVHYYFAH